MGFQYNTVALKSRADGVVHRFVNKTNVSIRINERILKSKGLICFNTIETPFPL